MRWRLDGAHVQCSLIISHGGCCDVKSATMNICPEGINKTTVLLIKQLTVEDKTVEIKRR